MLPAGMEAMMLVPNTVEYFSSPTPKASNAPKVSNTACHAMPRNRSLVLPECSDGATRFRNPTNALLTASQSPLAATVKNVWKFDAVSFVAAFACASFSATNDFNLAASSGFLSDSNDAICCLAQPLIKSPPPRMTAPSDLSVVFTVLRIAATPLTFQHHLPSTITE